ncbi:zinc-ribbon domain-containing protein, partial [Escherichia coli]|uniref:zinc-ribbon domain-containing protein n=1 Tax=Escherichia coli TaxID=562 RepID=UPI00207C3B72
MRDPKHEWQQPICKRVRGLGCPFCTIEDKSLEKLYPEIAKDWHPTLNGSITPNDVAARGRHPAFWQCP